MLPQIDCISPDFVHKLEAIMNTTRGSLSITVEEFLLEVMLNTENKSISNIVWNIFWNSPKKLCTRTIEGINEYKP